MVVWKLAARSTAVPVCGITSTVIRRTRGEGVSDSMTHRRLKTSMSLVAAGGAPHYEHVSGFGQQHRAPLYGQPFFIVLRAAAICRE